MLFDIEDYRSNGLIGLNQRPPTQQAWQDCKYTFDATLLAANIGLNRWIQGANRCASACAAEIDGLIAEQVANHDALVAAGDIFWGGLINSTHTKENYKVYSAALEAYMYTIRKLFSLLEGDKLTPKIF